MTFVQIEYFLEAARQKNITKAAETLFVSQQVISRQIQAIEKELDIKLMERTNKGIELTEAGKHLYRVWEKIIKEHDAALETAKILDEKETKFKVRIGIQDVPKIMDYMIPIFTQYTQENQNVEVDYYFGNPVWLYEKLKSNKIDIMIAFSSEIEDLENMWRVEYGTTGIRFGIIASIYTPLGKKDMIELKDLENTTLFIPETTYSRDAAERTLKYLERHGCKSKNIKFFDSLSALEMAVSMGQGVAVAYNALFRNDNKNLKFYEWDNIMGDKETEIVLVGENEKYYEVAKDMKKTFVR